MSSSNQDKAAPSPEEIDMHVNKQFNSTDGLFEYVQADPDRADPTGRVYHYAMMGGVRILYASIGRLAVFKVVHMLSASADVLALAKIEVDISKVAVGRTLTVKWRGKPVFIRHRTPEEISAAEHDDNADLRDKQKDSVRVKKPEWLIVVGICTHLGCVPMTGEGAYKGWYCPCHGSHYDTSGRIRIGPAPLNLEIPPYVFVEDSKIVVGVDSL
jgi:ubiquinol-cytochrome c reductase iron-sulfur subunit